MPFVWPTYCFWQQLQVNRKIRQFLLSIPIDNSHCFIVKTVVDFVRPLVVVTYKHVSFCYTMTNLSMITTTFIWTHPSFQRVELCSNQIATQFTSATERPSGLWTEYFFKILIHIKKIEIFPNDTAKRIQKWMVCHYKRYSIFTFIFPISLPDVKFKGTLMQIWKYANIFVFILK